MMKKIMSAMLAAVMLLLFCVPAMAAGAEFVITLPERAPKAGESFDVTLELKNNPGFGQFEFTLSYDKAVLECTEIVTEELLEGTVGAENPSSSKGAAIVAARVEDESGDGLLVTFKFKAITDAARNAITGAAGKLATAAGNPIETTITWLGRMGSASTPGTTNPPGPSEEKITFPDIAGHWGEKYIIRSAELGLFKGYGDGRFGPDDKVTRAQFVTVLYRMAGSPATGMSTPFVDTAGQIPEFQAAIAWAYNNGYVKGKTDTTFDPDGYITRQETLLILFRYNGGKTGAEAMFTGIYDEYYSDSADVADWAKTAVYWGVYHNIISGTSEHTLSPLGNASRAELAKILVGYLDKFQS